jgi:hypothetical protein
MKKIVFVAALLLSGICINAQEDSTPDFPRNEFKGNALFLILGSFELTYERLINDESGLGVSLNIPYIYDDWDLNFSVTPYYRYYFGNKPAAGFFAEGFGMLNNFRDYYSTYVGDWNSGIGYWDYNRKTRTDFALGIGIGGKWISRKGVLLEINAGVGRNIFGGSYDGEFELVGRGGITVGYRF